MNHHKFLASALDKDACTSSRPEGFTRANIWCQIWWTPQPNRTLSRREILYASLRKQPKFLGREPHILVNILNEIAVTNTYKYHNSSGREISVGITTCYGQDGLGVESRWGEKIFPTRPDRPWSTPRLLHNRYRAIPGIKQPGRDLNHPQPPSLLTPWCRDLLEQLTGLQLVKKFHAFHGTRRFITALTRVRHLSLSWASPIQSIYPHPTSWRSILILSTHLRLGLPMVSFPPVSPPRSYTPPSPHPYASHDQPISFFSILSPAQYWVRSTDHLAPRYAISSIPPLPLPS